MIGQLVPPRMTRDEWQKVRSEILARIAGSMGGPPRPAATTQYEEIRRYRAHELEHIHIRYDVIEDHWNEAVIVLPDGREDAPPPRPAILTIHGTNGEIGKFGVLDAEGKPDRAYAIELARRGYVTLSPDQFGFGASLEGKKQEDLFAAFFERWADWSLDGIRTLEQSRAIDLLATQDYVDASGGFGVMGNSLGGRAALHLAALDERITAAVPSCGLSPVCTNVYRLIRRDRYLCPPLSAHIEKDGKAIWDYHEMLALCAPRAVLLLEPFNDPYNPEIASVFRCFDSASGVYELLAEPEKLAIYAHGDGHDTVPPVRESAYRWFDRFLLGRRHA